MKRITIYMAVFAMLVSSCNTGEQKNNSNDTSYQTYADGVQIKEASPSSSQNNTVKPGSIPITKETNREDWDKKIIKKAFIRLAVKGYENFNKNIHESLKNYGAFIAEEEQNQDQGEKNNQVTIKVPADQFENLINSLYVDSIKVIERKITSEEVTGDIVDTQLRIETKKQVREKYLNLLKDAKNMKEVLDVQQEINSVQESIESAEGRVKYLTHQSAYSTIYLRYAEYIQLHVPSEETPGFFTRLTDGFNSGIQTLGTLIIFFVTIWPLLLTGTIVFILWKKRKSHQTNP